MGKKRDVLLEAAKGIYAYEQRELPENVTIKEKDKPILLAAIDTKADYI